MKLFNWFKKVKHFSPKKKNKYKTVREVSFTDLSGKEIYLTIQVNGNSTLLAIHDEKTEFEFLLDHELVALLHVLLQSYDLYEVFPDLEDDK